jgi:hypothetical protein
MKLTKGLAPLRLSLFAYPLYRALFGFESFYNFTAISAETPNHPNVTRAVVID